MRHLTEIVANNLVTATPKLASKSIFEPLPVLARCVCGTPLYSYSPDREGLDAPICPTCQTAVFEYFKSIGL